jgi:hypothetical protein
MIRPIDPDPQQMEKWRRQERVNRFLVATVIALVTVGALAGLTWLAVTLFQPPPLLTPTGLRDEFATWKGRTVRVRGDVKLVDANRIRLTDDKSSILCNFDEPIPELKDGNTVTVQGKVGRNFGLLNCAVIDH